MNKPSVAPEKGSLTRVRWRKTHSSLLATVPQGAEAGEVNHERQQKQRHLEMGLDRYLQPNRPDAVGWGVLVLPPRS